MEEYANAKEVQKILFIHIPAFLPRRAILKLATKLFIYYEELNIFFSVFLQKKYICISYANDFLGVLGV